MKGDDAQWRRDLIAHHTIRLGILMAKPADELLQCPICIGSDERGRELCCGGSTVTVAEAIAFHQRELRVLGAEVHDRFDVGQL